MTSSIRGLKLTHSVLITELWQRHTALHHKIIRSNTPKLGIYSTYSIKYGQNEASLETSRIYGLATVLCMGILPADSWLSWKKPVNMVGNKRVA
ncbi:hypothetical protein V144x_43750 [Gimesia aquarii]|uniref:Uncharacterized protein n=1 Tax=Gimesia aquarii TaxID=2527964 RepID=A0A517W0U6_9PLAN|nr:hypothetical protein V144x_43750 [Gimesia aquarii]